MNQPEIGNKLAEIRKSRGLTQSELAEKCDVSFRTIQRIENGKVTPRGFTIKTLSTALVFDFLKEFSDGSFRNDKAGLRRFIYVHFIIEQTFDVFNLKTNAMKKLSILTVIFGLLGLWLFSIAHKVNAQENTIFTNFLTIESNKEMSQKEAVRIIDEINKRANYHNKAIDLIKTYAEKSDNNYDTYVLISKLIGSFGHSTIPEMEIAQVVFFTSHDCNLFNDIVQLIFLNTGVHDDIYIKLAKSASVAETENDKDKIHKEIDKYKAQAKFKTLDEAFKNQ